MVLADVLTLVSLLSLGGIIGAAGISRLSRLDRLRSERMRQSACRWHRWQELKDGAWLVCALCGKKSRRLNPSHEEGDNSPPSWSELP